MNNNVPFLNWGFMKSYSRNIKSIADDSEYCDCYDDIFADTQFFYRTCENK